MGKLMYIGKPETVDERYFAESDVECLTDLIESALLEDDSLFYSVCSGNGDWVSFREVEADTRVTIIRRIDQLIEDFKQESLELDYCRMHGIFVWQTNV